MTDNADHQHLPNEVSTLITTCKELVTLSKRSSVNNNLETTLKQCVSTRWNSVLRMLQSVNDNRTQLRTTANDGPTNRKFLCVLSDLHDDILEQVISVLLPFDTATKVLSADKTPTLHIVLPTWYKLRQHLSDVSTDCDIIATLKRHLSQQLDKYFVVSDIHAAATLLDPRLKNNGYLMSEELKKDGIKALNTLLMTMQSHAPVPPVVEGQEPPRKAAHLDTSAVTSDDYLHDLFTSPQLSLSSCTPEEEVTAYIGDTTDMVVTNVLKFWKLKELSWPRLATVARILLGVPTTSTSSERSFSVAGRTLEERRSTLSPDHVDGLLFVHGL